MSARRWDLRPGDTIAPHLTAVRRLGGGHRYEAYLAFDEHRFCTVVAKMLRPDQVHDRSGRRGLAREADALARLAHPVLPRGFAAVLDGPRPHLVLEHLEGPRLSSLLRRFGPLALEQVLPLALEICSVLHYLAGESTVHLDVKPSNVIMGAPPRLIDLSVARTVAEAVTLDHPVGTDDYMAPEQYDPPRSGVPGPPADVWGLGATLYEACTGTPPYPVPMDRSSEWPQLTATSPPEMDGVPDAVGKPIIACLEHDPAARPTPAELTHMLEPAVAALPRPVLGGFRPHR
ncbi:MAG: serine/threonine-protein kinase [Actinomycetes bacterium]